MGRPGMSARWMPTASGPGALGGSGAGGGGGGAGVYTEASFTYTGGAQTFNLADTNGQPITAYLFGPGGGAEADTNTRGGAGGYTEGTINIPGNSGQLKIIVGGHGGPGQQNNGSGAGYTGIFTSSWNGNSVSTDHGAAILIAGGGGGSANSSSGSSHGGGAGGGSSGQRGNPSNSGGYGGGQSSGGQYRQTGGGYCTSGDQCTGQTLRGGVACGGGEGGSGVGWPNQIYGGNYASAAGGNGCNAGGGGAGYYGGAGGASSPNGGNGGGGSGYIGGHPSYPVEGAATSVGDGDTPPSAGRNSPFYSGQISYGGRHSHNRGNGSNQGGSGKVVITYFAPGSGGGGGQPSSPDWDIIMHTNGRKGNESNQGNTQRFGYTGQSSWRSISASSTSADSRTAFGAGVGLYNGYFNKKNITKVALVTGDGDLQSPTSHSKYLVYDLVEDSGSESFHDIINRLDQYNRSNSNWAGQNASGYNTPSVTNFTGNSNGYSGTLNENSGWSGASSNGSTPNRFAVWGINTDSDDDTQVLCSYYGSLSSGKGDSWRGQNPSQTFWSYWGNDWHSNSQSQTISNGKQSDPGIANGANYSNSLYLVAYGDPM